MNRMTHPLCETVQMNCDISDAQHAANYTLCVYLLKMREYYRWENGFSYSDILPKEDVGNWVQARENLWEKIEDQSLVPLKIDNKEYDPFDTENINNALAPKGFVYSGGFGVRSAPHFFLAKLEDKQVYDDFTIYVSTDECARDLTAPPAMTQGNNVFIRREALRRYLWEKFTEWQWHQYENAMSRALSFYDFENDVDHALDQMTDNELEAVTLHEIGEVIASKELGNRWRDMIVNLPRSRAEFLARAVKDLYADCLSTLPGIIEKNNSASLHFYAANLVAMRKELFPSFHIAYQTWTETGSISPLKSLVAQGVEHWQTLAKEMLKHHQDKNEVDLNQLENLVQSSPL